MTQNMSHVRRPAVECGRVSSNGDIRQSEGRIGALPYAAAFATGIAESIIWLLAILLVPVVLVGGYILLFPGDRDLQTLTQPMAAWDDAVSVESALIRGYVRSEPGTDFTSTNVSGEMVPFEIWTTFGNSPMWRATKPGHLSIAWHGKIVSSSETPNNGTRPVISYTFGLSALGWIGPFAWLPQLFDTERLLARTRPTQAEVRRWTDAAGHEKITITITDMGSESPKADKKAETFFRPGGIREYTMDRATRRLESTRMFVREGDRRQLLLETELISLDSFSELAYTIPDEFAELAASKPPEVFN